MQTVEIKTSGREFSSDVHVPRHWEPLGGHGYFVSDRAQTAAIELFAAMGGFDALGDSPVAVRVTFKPGKQINLSVTKKGS